MERLAVTPRPDWQAKVESLGFAFHTAEDIYWDESACYRFTRQEVDELEAVTNELHSLCLQAVERVIEENLFDHLRIPQSAVPLIKNSWEREDLSLYGRFDLWYDGHHQPKLYEYNADTPTSLFEAGAVQWYWLQDQFPKEDQFNSIHEKLLARWKEGKLDGPVHFACVRGSTEDFVTIVYLEDTAVQTGLKTKRLFMDEIGWDGRQFVDLENQPIKTLFKLYPWEWLIEEEFGTHLLREPWQLIEPAWKMVLSNKGILPLLWEMFPSHPNLLPAYATPEPLGDTYIKKPLLGREGASLTVRINGREVTTPGDYGEEGHIYQAFLPPPEIEGRYPVIGSWVVRDESAGLGIREADTPITQNTSRFIPHYFSG